MGLRRHRVSTFWKGHLLAQLVAELSKVIHDQIFLTNFPHSVYGSDYSDKKHPTSCVVPCGAEAVGLHSGEMFASLIEKRETYPL